MAAASYNNTSYGGNYIYNTMNSTIYNSLDSTLRNQIASGRYYFRAYAGTTWVNNFTAANTYNYERNGSAYWGNGYADCNIALLNVSDYKYATLASNCARTNTGNYDDSNCGGKNWIGSMMKNNISNNWTWVINPSGYYNGSNHFYCGNPGLYASSSNPYIGNSNLSPSSQYYVFPVFYLKNQIYPSKGNGTSSNPYYVAI